jgi:hypothetical protein
VSGHTISPGDGESARIRLGLRHDRFELLQLFDRQPVDVEAVGVRVAGRIERHLQAVAVASQATLRLKVELDGPALALFDRLQELAFCDIQIGLADSLKEMPEGRLRTDAGIDRVAAYIELDRRVVDDAGRRPLEPPRSAMSLYALWACGSWPGAHC